MKTNKISVNVDDSLVIMSDEIVNLYNKRGGRGINCELRLIKAINNDQQALYFLTNFAHLSAYDMGEAYKRKWDTEIFFKLIKKNLQIKYFINHNKKGMMVYIYCILIAAIFKTTHQLTGFKIALLEFKLAIEKEIIKDSVCFCGGDPDLINLRL